LCWVSVDLTLRLSRLNKGYQTSALTIISTPTLSVTIDVANTNLWSVCKGRRWLSIFPAKDFFPKVSGDADRFMTVELEKKIVLRGQFFKAKLAPTEKVCAYRKILPSQSCIVDA
jgi:hypothetical protein